MAFKVVGRNVGSRVMASEKAEPERFVFVDEMGANTSLSPLHAWSRRGRWTYCSVPRNRGPNTALLRSMSVESMGPSMVAEGTTAAAFEVYVEEVLAPSLRLGRAVVMDNLSAHKGNRVRKLVEEPDCERPYLPAYSPDLNPVEEIFVKTRGILRKTGARTREALVEALSAAISAVTARDVRALFGHRGYRAVVRSFR